MIKSAALQLLSQFSLLFIEMPCKSYAREAHQLLVVWHPGDVVPELVVVDRLRPEQLLRELVRAPRHQNVPGIEVERFRSLDVSPGSYQSNSPITHST